MNHASRKLVTVAVTSALALSGAGAAYACDGGPGSYPGDGSGTYPADTSTTGASSADTTASSATAARARAR